MTRTPPPPLRTYSHLAGRQRVPSEYEITTTGLLYYLRRGFEVDVPVAPWYERHQRQSPLRCSDWERFADPRETTYAAYTAAQADKEAHLDAVVRSAVASGHDQRLSVEWQATLERLLPPLRFVWHGFQMAAAYIGQMAPSGRLTLVAAFQAADEMRRIHRIAYRMAQLRGLTPEFGAGGRADWQDAPAWQPLRRALERTLVAYDWGESFTALCLCLKPALDHLLVQVSALARDRHDFCLAEFLSSFDEDNRWHQAWAEALVRLLREESADNVPLLRRWRDQWQPGADEAVAAVAELAGGDGRAAAARARLAFDGWQQALGLAP